MNQGTKVGTYVLERQLGEGGQGSVWQASQPNEPSSRPVALKVIPVRGSSPVTLERLRREAQALVRLSSGHPSLVGCHGVVEDAALGVMAIVMDKVEGVDLQAALADPRCGDEAKALMLTHVARALAHLHEAGVVHRDIKPQNILITHGFFANPSDEATVKVVDFGIAIIAGNPKPLTEIGTVIGTPAYMSPERIDPLFWQARPGLPSEDVWAFGVVAYEAFFRQHPTGVSEEGLLSDYAERYRNASRTYEPWPPNAATHPWEMILRGALALRASERLPSGAAIIAAIGGRRVPNTLNDPPPRHTAAQPPSAFAFQPSPTPPPASGFQPSATPPPASATTSGAPPAVERTEVNPVFEPRPGAGAALAGAWGTSPAPPPAYYTPSAPAAAAYGPGAAAYGPMVAYGAPPHAPPPPPSTSGRRSPFTTALLTGAAGLMVVGLTILGFQFLQTEAEPPTTNTPEPPPRTIDTATPPPTSPGTSPLPVVPPIEPPPRNTPAVPTTKTPPKPPGTQPGTAGGPGTVIINPQAPPPQTAPPTQTQPPFTIPFPLPFPTTPQQPPPQQPPPQQPPPQPPPTQTQPPIGRPPPTFPTPPPIATPPADRPPPPRVRPPSDRNPPQTNPPQNPPPTNTNRPPPPKIRRPF